MRVGGWGVGRERIPAGNNAGEDPSLWSAALGQPLPVLQAACIHVHP